MRYSHIPMLEIMKVERQALRRVQMISVAHTPYRLTWCVEPFGDAWTQGGPGSKTELLAVWQKSVLALIRMHIVAVHSSDKHHCDGIASTHVQQHYREKTLARACRSVATVQHPLVSALGWFKDRYLCYILPALIFMGILEREHGRLRSEWDKDESHT